MNSQFFQRVAKLVPYPSKHATVPALAFAYHFEPPADQELQSGSLFIAIEVMAKDALASQIVDLIIKTIGEEYYNKKFSDEAEVRFEKSVAVLNTQLAKLHETHHGKQINGLNAVVAVLNQDHLYLTQCGKAHARLYRGSKCIDLAEGLSDGSSKQKTFHGIAEGNLKEKDKLLFATPAVLFEFESKNLNQIVTDNSPASCVQKLSSQLDNENGKSRCAALVVELTSLEQAAAEPLESEPSTAMVGKAQTKLDDMKAATAPIASKASQKLSRGVDKGHAWWKHKAWPSAKHNTKTWWNKLWTNYINPNPKKALSVVVTTILILIFGLYALTSNNFNYRNLATNYKEVIALTETAEAQQSMGKEDQSKTTILSATNKLNLLTKQYTDQQIKRAVQQDSDLSGQKNISVAELKSRQSLLADKLNNVTRLTPSDVVDFSSIPGFVASFVVQLDDRIYTVDTKSGSLYQIDPNKKTYAKVGQSDGLKSAVAATPSSGRDSIYILTSAPSVLQYSPGKAVTTVKLSGGDWSTGVAIASYVGNLYILAPKDNQIYRHSRTSIGFSASSSYVKRANTTSLKNAASLAINGTIIVADGTRDLTVFTNGLGAATSISKLPERVKGVKQIQLRSASSLLALTDQTTQLASLEINDQGISFTKQYALPAGLAVTSYSVDSAGTLYVLTGKKLTSSKL